MWKYRENRFDLKVIGYQFCEAKCDNIFDKNWLIIKIKVQDEKKWKLGKRGTSVANFRAKTANRLV